MQGTSNRVCLYEGTLDTVYNIEEGGKAGARGPWGTEATDQGKGEKGLDQGIT